MVNGRENGTEESVSRMASSWGERSSKSWLENTSWEAMEAVMTLILESRSNGFCSVVHAAMCLMTSSPTEIKRSKDRTRGRCSPHHDTADLVEMELEHFLSVNGLSNDHAQLGVKRLIKRGQDV